MYFSVHLPCDESEDTAELHALKGEHNQRSSSIICMQYLFCNSDKETSGAGSGCAKMDTCGTTEQQQTITFRAVDNRKRDGIDYLTVIVSEGERNNIPRLAFGSEVAFPSKARAK